MSSGKAHNISQTPCGGAPGTKCFKGLPFISLTGTWLGEGRLQSLGDFLQPAGIRRDSGRNRSKVSTPVLNQWPHSMGELS